MKRWLVVELLITKEIGEAVSNFLVEQGATGIEELEGDLERERLRAYFAQDERKRRILDVLHRYLKSLNRLFPKNPRAQITTVFLPEQDWAENWKRFFKPIHAASRFLIKPPWSRVRLKKGQIPIEISPGMAFGTGTHPTTILCIQAMEERLKRKGQSVLDVGMGSGILSVIAAKLGAKEVWGIDIDSAALENARENVERNEVSNIIKIRKGSIGSLRKKFDLIVANIDLKNLRRIRRSFVGRLKNQGFLILSGVLDAENERIRLHYLETGRLRWIKTAQKGEWVCLTFRKK